MANKTLVESKADPSEGCAGFPELVRMNYFHGQMLMPRDFLAEQAYHRNKQLLINRCLHGYGVICGLLLEPIASDVPCVDPKEAKADEVAARVAELERQAARLEASAQDDELLRKLETELELLRRRRDALGSGKTAPADVRHTLKLSCGFALDPVGHETIVAHEMTFDLGARLPAAARAAIAKDGEALLYVSICYDECGFEAVRPAALDNCQITPSCQDARIREAYRIAITLESPDRDERCEPCCSASCESCVLLATVRVRAGCPLRPQDVDNSVRRPFGLHAPTVITGINWHHAGCYEPDDAQSLLGSGLEIRFSRPIHVATIKRGVVELLSFAGGRGVAGAITHISHQFVDLPASGMVDRLRIRDTTEEQPRIGDRILVTLRCDFLLDACCRPVDGNHLGGRVACVGEPPGKEPAEQHGRHGPAIGPCAWMPGRGGPWTSGNGVPGGNFESWFFIDRETVE